MMDLIVGPGAELFMNTTNHFNTGASKVGEGY